MMSRDKLQLMSCWSKESMRERNILKVATSWSSPNWNARKSHRSVSHDWSTQRHGMGSGGSMNHGIRPTGDLSARAQATWKKKLANRTKPTEGKSTCRMWIVAMSYSLHWDCRNFAYL